MRVLLLRPPLPPPAAANGLLLSAASGRPLLLRARRMAAGPPPPAAAAAAEFPAGPVLDSGGSTRPRRRRSVAGVDQDDLLDPGALADPDSSFCDINGISFHHKVYSAHHEEEGSASASGSGAGAGVPVVLLHGFGASLFSWSRVMRPLARVAGAKVLAFDRPAFGLTSRAAWSGPGGDDTKPLNPYSMAFSAMATLAFVDLLGAGKAVLVGHSAGCLVAVDACLEAPERVAALVLVAPAIFVPGSGTKGERRENGEEGQEKDSDDDSNGPPPLNPFARIWRGFLGMCMWIAGLVLKVVMAVQDVVRALAVQALVALLRSPLGAIMVRLVMDKFGVMAVRNAWYDASKVTDHVIQGYTKPLRSRGWERALLEHTISMITDSTPKSRLPVSKRLSEISCPVLVVTGDTDRLVPAWNAERVARAIPGAAFEVIKNCGHLPHEEKPEEFLSVVERFLRGAFGTPDEQVLQAAA